MKILMATMGLDIGGAETHIVRSPMWSTPTPASPPFFAAPCAGS